VNCLLPTTGVTNFWPLLIVAAVIIVAGIGFVLFQRLRHRGKPGVGGTATLVILPLALGALLLVAAPAPTAQAATTQSAQTANCVADPGDPGNPGGGTPGSTPTPTPSSTVPPVCIPTVLPNIDFTFADWTIAGTGIDSPPLVPATSVPELVDLRSQTGGVFDWVPADSQTTVSTTTPAATATAQSVIPNYTNSNGEGGVDQASVLALASTLGVDNDFTVTFITNFPYNDGCNNLLFAAVTYTGFYHVAPTIPE
jgi:hypothetical protein